MGYYFFYICKEYSVCSIGFNCLFKFKISFMKKITLLMALIVSAFALQVSAQNPVFEGDTGFVNDNNCAFGFDEFDAEVTGIGVIGDTDLIDEIRLNISHTWSGDLNIFFRRQMVRQLLSCLRVMVVDLTMLTLRQSLVMKVHPAINAAAAPFTGRLCSEGGSIAEAFAGVDGSGDWTLLVCDDVGQDTGAVDQWSIRFQPNTEDLSCSI